MMYKCRQCSSVANEASNCPTCNIPMYKVLGQDEQPNAVPVDPMTDAPAAPEMPAPEADPMAAPEMPAPEADPMAAPVEEEPTM